MPELITSSEPGELSVIRTAGNLVPAYGHGADGVTNSVEYGVTVLGVRRIVVCGHSACGAMTALAEGHDLTQFQRSPIGCGMPTPRDRVPATVTSRNWCGAM